MAKILNLDALAKEARVLTIGGVDYPVDEMSVGNFIETSRAAEQMNGKPLSEQVEESIRLVQRGVPSLDEVILRKLPLKHLQTIIAFVRGDEVEEAAEAAAPGAQAEHDGKAGDGKAAGKKGSK